MKLEEMYLLREEVLQAEIEKEREKNPELFEKSQHKLDFIKNPHAELPFAIDKKEILSEVRKRLLEAKCVLVDFRKEGITINDPVTYLTDIEIYSLLVEYLENDNTLDLEDVKTKRLFSR